MIFLELNNSTVHSAGQIQSGKGQTHALPMGMLSVAKVLSNLVKFGGEARNEACDLLLV